MKKRGRFSPEEVAKALRQTDGLQARAAEILGCTQAVVAGYVARYPEVRAARDAAAMHRPSRERFTPEQVAEALRAAGGNKARAAERLGCVPGAVTKYIARHACCRAAWEAGQQAQEEGRRAFRARVAEALRQTGGNKSQAAELAGCTRSMVAWAVARDAGLREVAESGQPAGARHERFDPEEVAEALRQSGGIKSRAARRLGCSRGTIDNYVQRHPAVREAWQDAREELLDEAELSLIELVRAGKWQAVRYVLSTLGKDRGYTFQIAPKRANVGAAEDQEARYRETLAVIERLYAENAVPGPEDKGRATARRDEGPTTDA